MSRGRSRRGRECAATRPRAPGAPRGSTAHLGRALAGESELGHRRSSLGIGEVRRPDEAHPFERQLFVGRAGGGELVELARPRAQVFRRPAEDLLVELRPATVPYRAERVDGEHAEEPLRHGFRDMEGQVPAPRVADDVRPLPAEPVEDAPGVRDVRRDGVGPLRRRRLEPSLLVPRDVVLLRELVGEAAQIVEAEPRPAVQQQHRRPAAGAATREQRAVVLRRELRPGHRRRSSHVVTPPRRGGGSGRVSCRCA